MRKFAFLIAEFLLVATGYAQAQTWTQMQWGMNKASGSPYTVGLNLSGIWYPVGTVSSVGSFAFAVGLPTSISLGGVFSTASVANQFVTGLGTDGIFTRAQPAFSDLSGQIASSQLIAPGASTLGGVKSSSAGTNQFATGIDTSGAVTYAQPTFNNLANVSTQLFGAANSWTAQQAFGSGTFAATPNFTGSIVTSPVLGLLGSVATPDTTQTPVAAWQKTSGSTATTGVQQTTYTSMVKRTTGANTRATAAFFETNDPVGGVNSFGEGVRSHSVVTGGTLGSAYGAVLMGGTGPNIGYLYLVGAELNTENHSGTDAPALVSFSKTSFSAAAVATNVVGATGTDNKSDAAFLTNPYSTKPYRTGFLAYGNDGTQTGVDESAFAVKYAIPYGLNLVNGSYSSAAILLPNLGVVRARNAAGNADHNIMYYDGSNNLVFGTDATQINLPAPVYATKGLQSTGAYTGAFSDGIVLDYVNGTARISAGSSDGITFFNNGVGGVNIGAITPAGEFLTTNHYLAAAAPPTPSACGTSPTVSANSSNHGGNFTTGTVAPTACTLTFASAFPNAAFCTIYPANAAAAGATVLPYVSTNAKTGFIVTMAVGTSGASFNYTCQGN